MPGKEFRCSKTSLASLAVEIANGRLSRMINLCRNHFVWSCFWLKQALGTVLHQSWVGCFRIGKVELRQELSHKIFHTVWLPQSPSSAALTNWSETELVKKVAHLNLLCETLADVVVIREFLHCWGLLRL